MSDVTMLSAMETAVKCEVELPLNLKTHGLERVWDSVKMQAGLLRGEMNNPSHFRGNETRYKGERDPADCRTLEHPDPPQAFGSSPQPQSPPLSQVPEHLLMAVNSITSAASGLAATSSIITTNTTNNATTATTTVNSNSHGGGGSTTPTNTATACGGPPQQQQPQQPQPQPQTQTPQHHVGCHNNGSCNANHSQNAGLPPQQNNGAHSQNTSGTATHPPNPGAGHPQSTGGHTNCGATHTYTDANCGANQGFSEHSGHPAPSPFSAANGVFPRKSPPINNQNPNHMTSHVTTLPSSIGRLTLGLASHYAPSPIPEQEEIQSPVSSDTSINVARWATFRDSEGRRDSEYSDVPDEQRPPLHISLAGGVSPPPSPPTAASPAPTMAPGHGGSSPVSGLATLHHALHGLHNLHNLHNLQNFHNLQQNLQTQMAALAGLQGGLGVPGVGSLLHPPLAPQQHPAPAAPSPAGISPAPPPANGNNASAVPQMVLTSGHVTQGVQGAQLLIPTSQGIAVQPILTIPLGQAGVQGSSSLVNPLVPLHHLQHQGPHPQHTGSATSSPLPPNSSSNSSSSSSSSSTSAAPHPLLGLAGLPPSLFHAHHAHNNNNNNNSNNNNNNNMGTPDKPKLPLSLSSPVTADAVGALGARMGTHYPAPPPPPPTARYSPDFLDNHTGSTGGPPYWQLDLRMAPSLKNPGCITDDDDQPTISQSTGNLVDGVNLDEIKEFAKAFKIRRLSMGLTQTQVGQALSITEGPAYSQSAICRFEKLDITPKSAQKIKPVLERWMQEAEDRYKNGQHTLTEFMGTEPSKKRKRRTSFTPQALEVLNGHFERNTHPSGAEITALAEQLGYEREVVRIWFCNKRQALKNTVRMMAKSSPTAPPPPPPPHPTLN